jgi:hypothetical protein
VLHVINALCWTTSKRAHDGSNTLRTILDYFRWQCFLHGGFRVQEDYDKPEHPLSLRLSTLYAHWPSSPTLVIDTKELTQVDHIFLFLTPNSTLWTCSPTNDHLNFSSSSKERSTTTTHDFSVHCHAPTQAGRRPCSRPFQLGISA